MGRRHTVLWNMAVKLNIGTVVGRAGSPLPAAVANQRFLIRLAGAHGVTRPTCPNVAKNCYSRPQSRTSRTEMAA